MKKNLKKQMKQDELVTWFGDTREFVRKRGEQFKLVLIGAGVLALGVVALAYFRTQRDREAREGMDQALATFHATVASETAQTNPPTPSRFATQSEKYKQALTEFENVERRYGSHALAVRARYYAALCKIELGQVDDAATALKDIAARPGSDLLEPALARLALADLTRRKGQIEEAAKAYQQIVDDQKGVVPRDHALMGLAQTLEQARRLDEAQAAYRRLVQEFPTSAYAGEAQKRVEYLQARG